MNVVISRRSGNSWQGFVLCAAVLLGGCESTAIMPGGTVPLVVNPAEKSESISVPLTHLLALTLPPAPAAHSWQIAYHDMRYLKQQTGFVPAGKPGVGPTISFLAVGLGSTRLHLLLLPEAGSGGLDPVDHHEIRVRIQ
jgi:hypothetical protein